jgi:chemotaxis protein CheD
VTEVYLNPGEWFVGDHHCRAHTLLGSCVSITLWDPVLRLGAMSHFLLATGPVAKQAVPDGRYADGALLLMLRGLAERGAPAWRCEAKIFGGGDMFPARRPSDRPPQERLHVGRRNGETARELLKQHGIVVRSESLFGEGHRKIVFDVASGHVWVRQVPVSAGGA